MKSTEHCSKKRIFDCSLSIAAQTSELKLDPAEVDVLAAGATKDKG